MSVDTSLKELEEKFAVKTNWKQIGVPLEEFRMIDPPQPNQAGQVVFGKCGKGTKIENYAVVQTIDNLNALILDKYNKEKEKPRLQENPWLNPRQRPELRAITFPNLKQDVEVEIKLKKALEDMMDGLRIPCLIIR